MYDGGSIVVLVGRLELNKIYYRDIFKVVYREGIIKSFNSIIVI